MVFKIGRHVGVVYKPVDLSFRNNNGPFWQMFVVKMFTCFLSDCHGYGTMLLTLGRRSCTKETPPAWGVSLYVWRVWHVPEGGIVFEKKKNARIFCSNSTPGAWQSYLRRAVAAMITDDSTKIEDPASVRARACGMGAGGTKKKERMLGDIIFNKRRILIGLRDSIN